MILHDLMNRGKAQSNAFCLSIADEGLKEIFANRVGNPRTVVRHSNLDAALGHPACDIDLS
jgi:hypothetical protein